MIIYAIFFILAVIFFLYLLKDSFRPPAFLLFITPLQFIINRNFGIISNLITIIVVAAFLLHISKLRSHSMLSKYLLQTNLQKIIAVFVLLLFIPFFISLFTEVEAKYVLVYSKQVTLFFLIAIFSFALRNEQNIRKFILIFISSTLFMYIITMSDLFFGINILVRGNEASISDILQRQGINETTVGLIRFGQYMGPNSFAYYGLLPFFLAIGNMMIPDKTRTILWIKACVVLLLGFGLIGSGSRSALLGVVVGAVSLVVMLKGKKRAKFIAFIILILGLAVVYYDEFNTIEVVVNRVIAGNQFVTGAYGRFTSWSFGLELFRESPLFGVGYGGYYREFILTNHSISHANPHSAYIQLLSEGGLIAFVPFMIIVMLSSKLMLSKTWSATSYGLEYWRPFFFAGFIAMLTSCIFNSYHYDRVFWIAISFAVALSMHRSNRSKQPVLP